MPTLDVTGLKPNGHGVARLGTQSIQVEGAIPGDRVQSVCLPDAKPPRHAIAQILTPSAERVTPSCPVDAQCGGCDLSMLRFEARVHVLGQMLSDLFQRPNIAVYHAQGPLGHRARIKLQVRECEVGYFGAKTHELVAIDACEIARPELTHAIRKLTSLLREHVDHCIESVELRSDGERVVLAVQTRSGARESDLSWLAALGDVAVNGRTRFGETMLWIPVDGVRLRASAQSFYQVNLAGNDVLVAFVISRILQIQPEHVLDLYAGIGNFSIPLARRGLGVTAVESSGAALRDLRATASMLGLPKITTHTSLAERFDPSFVAFDAAILDPPRAGAGDVLARVLRNRPRRVVYVACHAPSAVRDLQRHAGDYQVSEVVGFDLFPQTHHVETVVVLDRKP